MSVMDLIVPFLQLRQSIVTALGEWVDGGLGWESRHLEVPTDEELACHGCRWVYSSRIIKGVGVIVEL